MEAHLSAFSAFVADHHGWAGAVLGLAAFLESLLLIGAFVPATALMLTAGALIGGGALDATAVLLWCAGGATLGDGLSYEAGRRLGAGRLRGRLFRKHRRAIARTRLFSRRFGVSSIFLGRFFGPLRAFVPVMAGMFGMSARRFQIANLASAFVWVAVLLAPGYLAARGLTGLDVNAMGLAATVLAAKALVVAGIGVLILAWRRGRKVPAAGVQRLRALNAS